MKRPTVVKSVAPEVGGTGLPFLHTWKSVYLLVIVLFALWVALLVALTDFFS
jgi:hypothetical protein